MHIHKNTSGKCFPSNHTRLGCVNCMARNFKRNPHTQKRHPLIKIFFLVMVSNTVICAFRIGHQFLWLVGFLPGNFSLCLIMFVSCVLISILIIRLFLDKKLPYSTCKPRKCLVPHQPSRCSAKIQSVHRWSRGIEGKSVHHEKRETGGRNTYFQNATKSDFTASRLATVLRSVLMKLCTCSSYILSEKVEL